MSRRSMSGRVLAPDPEDAASDPGVCRSRASALALAAPLGFGGPTRDEAALAAPPGCGLPTTCALPRVAVGLVGDAAVTTTAVATTQARTMRMTVRFMGQGLVRKSQDARVCPERAAGTRGHTAGSCPCRTSTS